MKILFVVLGIYESDGGIQRFSRRILHVLSELIDSRKISSTQIISLWDSAQRPKEIPPNITFSGFQKSKIRTLLSFAGSLLFSRPNVILLGHIYLSPLAVLSKLVLPNVRCLLVVYGVEVWGKPNWFHRWVVNNFIETIVSISNFTTEKMSNYYRLSRNRFSQLPLAVDIIGKYDIKAECAVTNILSVCRLSKASRHKNIDKVIMALPSVLRKFPNLVYMIVGDGDWRTDLEILCQELGLIEHVHFHGMIDDKSRDELYRNSDIFVLPSSGEGFGIVYLEAWQFFLPVIASNEGAAPEVVENGVDGFCVPPTPIDISNAICLLLEDAKLRKKMGQAGWQKINKLYSQEVFASRLEIILIENHEYTDGT